MQRKIFKETKVFVVTRKKHPLIGMRDPKTTHEILSKCGMEAVHLCICCAKKDTELCPHKGNEPSGVCGAYLLDERDVPKMEERIRLFLVKAAD